MIPMTLWKKLALTLVFIWFMAGGIAHFTHPAFFVAIVPPYLSYPLELVYVSGVFEILGAVGILSPQLRHWAGRGLILLVISVTPANIHMWLHPELFPDIPHALLSLRLLVQIALIACIWWSTRRPAGFPGTRSA